MRFIWTLGSPGDPSGYVKAVGEFAAPDRLHATLTFIGSDFADEIVAVGSRDGKRDLWVRSGTTAWVETNPNTYRVSVDPPGVLTPIAPLMVHYLINPRVTETPRAYLVASDWDTMAAGAPYGTSGYGMIAVAHGLTSYLRAATENLLLTIQKDTSLLLSIETNPSVPIPDRSGRTRTSINFPVRIEYSDFDDPSIEVHGRD